MTGLSAFFVREGALFVPTGKGASPWNRQAHGGVSLGGLVAHVVDRVPCPAPMQVTRITLDILGAIPLEPLTCATRIVREGRKVQLVEIDFLVEEKVWLRASALRLRTQDSPPHVVALNYPYPDASTPIQHSMGWFESISVFGDLQTPGPGACWVRFPIEVVRGEAITPLETVVMASDFGSGISTPFTFKEWTYANLDISVHLSRLPCSDWLLIDGVSDSAGNGVAVSNTRLGDQLGLFGMAHQSVFLERRAS